MLGFHSRVQSSRLTRGHDRNFLSARACDASAFTLVECSCERLREENEVTGCRDFGKLENPNAGRIPGSGEVTVDQTAG